jgi:hypothetical protein
MSMYALRLAAEGEGSGLPTGHDFLTSAGFGGAAAVLAAVIVALVAVFVARQASRRHQLRLEQKDRHHREVRDDELRAAAVDRCWQRLVWVVETAGIEPAASENATLGLGPELALELLHGLLRDAEEVGDDTLAKGVTVYLNQFALVLAQQAGSLSGLATARPGPKTGPKGPLTKARVDEKPRPAPKPPTPREPREEASEPSTQTAVVAEGKRRRG